MLVNYETETINPQVDCQNRYYLTVNYVYQIKTINPQVKYQTLFFLTVELSLTQENYQNHFWTETINTVSPPTNILMKMHSN